jgi:hypothetical protein
MSKSEKSTTPTAAQFVAAALAQIVTPLSMRLAVLELDDASLTLTGDFLANAWKVSGNLPAERFTEDERFHSNNGFDLYLQPVRLNRLNIVDSQGNPSQTECDACPLVGYLGKIAVPFSELATRNATISLYELDWLLSQYVESWERFAVSVAVHSVEQAGN